MLGLQVLVKAIRRLSSICVLHLDLYKVTEIHHVNKGLQRMSSCSKLLLFSKTNLLRFRTILIGLYLIVGLFYTGKNIHEKENRGYKFLTYLYKLRLYYCYANIALNIM